MKSRWMGAIFIAPATLLLLIFYIAPIFYSARLGFYNVRFGVLEWVGFANFKIVLYPGPFWDAIRTSGKFLCAILFFDLVLAYMIALGLDRLNPRIAALMRTCYYLPVVLSAVATISVWRWFFRYGGGAFNKILSMLSLPLVMWLGHPRIAPWALCLALSMGTIGISTLLYSAALGQLNVDWLDAARIDGASELRIIWHIITPLIRPTMFYIFITNTIGAFQIWAHPYFFTGGGPLGSTSTVAYEIFNTAFGRNDFGLASAMTAVTSVLTIFLAWFFLRWSGFGHE